MSPTTEQLLNTALALSNEDRLDLAEALFESVEPAAGPRLHESWREIIQQRSAELASGAVTPISWQEVKQRLRAKVTNSA